MRRLLSVTFGCLLSAAVAFSTQVAERFEVVSIKTVEANSAAAAAGVRGGGGRCGAMGPTIDPSRITITNTCIYHVIAWAYGIRMPGDLALISSEPTWVRSDQYVIEATFPQQSGPDGSTSPLVESALRDSRVQHAAK